MNTSSPIILLENATKEFRVPQLKKTRDYFKHIFWKSPQAKTITALNAVDLQINQGEKVGLVGLNGAGKSTMIKSMLGILQLTQGKAELFGRCSYAHRMKNNLRLGAVFGQRCQLRWDLSANDSFRLLAAMYRVTKNDYQARLKNLTSDLELLSFLHQPVRSLSLGQKMRCELAAAFLHNPEVVFLDEPTLGLDLIVKDSIQKLLKKSDKTILISSHDVSDIENICDRILILHEGKILFDGRKDEISQHLNHYGRAAFRFRNETVMCDQNFLMSQNIQAILAEKHTAEFILHDTKQLPKLIEHLLAQNELVDVRWIQNDLKELIRHYHGHSS